MPRIKLAAITLVTILAIIVVLQNTEAVETRLLFMSINMPRAVLLFVVFLMGFVVGLFTASHLARARKPGPVDPPQPGTPRSAS